MDIFSIFSLLGGLALFLYGMHVMSVALEKMAGGKMEQILRRMTSNRFKGLALGTGITAVVQSSSAVTVMLVGLVNSGIMQLSQAISVTMGSNIGTTVTAWVLSLAGISGDQWWLQMLKPSTFTPIIAFIGILLIMVSKKQKRRDAGTICVGFAVLMYGMTMMTAAVAPLSEMASFRQILTAFSNPLLGVLVGLVFTAVIQSSSASVGVLQALSLTGSVTYASAIPIIMGQNIGTCISALLSSIGTNKNARRVAVVHVLFNCIGTVICLTLWTIANAVFDFAFAKTAASPAAIAIIHSIFNVTTTVMLVPFAKVLEKISRLIVRDSKNTDDVVLLDERLITMPSFAVAKSMSTTVKMAELSRKSVSRALELMNRFEEKRADEVVEMENQLDAYEDHLGTYLVKLSAVDMPDTDSARVSMLLHTINDFERIGDHAINLLSVAREMHNKNIAFSHEARNELAKLEGALHEILSLTVQAFETEDLALAETVEPLEQVIDALISEIKSRHVSRLKNGNCTIELGFILTDLLTNCERISDHCSNVAVAMIETARGAFDTHEYLNALKSQPTGKYAQQYDLWLKQYSISRDEA